MTCCGSDQTLSVVSKWISTCGSQTPCSSNSSVSMASPVEFNLEEILKKTVSGEDIIKKYKEKQILTDADQNTISRVIVDYFQLHNIKMDPKVMAKVAKDIKVIFPNEIESTYYIPRNKGKNPSGKIYDRYFNSGYKRKKLLTSSSKKSTGILMSREANESSDNIQSVDSKEFLNKKKFLLFNIPSNIIQIWKETSQLRMQENKYPLNDFIKQWPRYKDSNGDELIDIDFETMYPGKGHKLFEKIEEFETKLNKTFYPNSIRDKLFLDYYDKMKSNEISAGIYIQFNSEYFILINLFLFIYIYFPQMQNTSTFSL